MNYFDDNITLLQKHDPALARRVLEDDSSLECAKARNGLPTLRYQSIYLHSAYDPVNEAQKSVSEFSVKPGSPVLVYGLGFGYHVVEILNKCSETVIVIEPLMAVFRAFLFAVDLRPFLPRTRFLVAEPVPRILARNQPSLINIFRHKPSLQISKSYFIGFDKAADCDDYLSKHQLKVLVVNPIYGGSLPTAQSCAKALENLGHEVVSVNCDDFADSFSSLDKVTRNKENKAILSNLFMQFMGEVIIAKAVEFQPDLIISIAQAPMTKETIARLKVLGAPVAFWFVEDFRVLTYWKDIAAHYDYFLTIQTDAFFEELRAININNYYYLPQACLPSLHRKVDLTTEDKKIYSSDLSFMGAPYYNRVQSFPKLLDHNFKIWGSGWDSNSILGPCLQKNSERVSSEECVKIFNGARINLNLHSSTFHEDVNPNGDFINPRTFEISSCGGFQLVDDRQGLDELYRIGDEIITFDSIDSLNEKIAYYLSHEEERLVIAAKARDRVLKEHTMEHRMKELLIYIAMDRLEGLKPRIEARKSTFSYFMEQAGQQSELGLYLEQFKNVKDFSLKTLVDRITEGEGTLSKNELLILMLDQVVREAS